MARVNASGGGAPSRARIANQLFSKNPDDKIQWCDLSPEEQRMVLRWEVTLQKWKVGRSVGAVFSSECHRDVSTLNGQDAEPCLSCCRLFSLHTFQVALNRKIPDEPNWKYVPKAHQDPDLGTIYLKYKGVRQLVEQVSERCADGTYKSETLLGMVKALALKQKRLDTKKSLKNMKYDTAFDQFCDLLASISKRAYLTFQKHFGGRGLRSMRYVWSTERLTTR
ncbi:hypothetical protein B0H19DRAFT_969390 [Mycena capillaripes]|nr:hypothetical protein B0H19DRAFT_969390 [Mycena capillaripes]